MGEPTTQVITEVHSGKDKQTREGSILISRMDPSFISGALSLRSLRTARKLSSSLKFVVKRKAKRFVNYLAGLNFSIKLSYLLQPETSIYSLY
jgi:hypothetical protein